METFLDMQNRLTDDLMVAAASTLFTTDRKKKLLQSAHLWATSLYSWPELQRGRTTNSIIGYEYYDYPGDFRTDTLGEFLYFNGKPHRRKAWNDYLEHQRKNPSSTKRIFADYGRQYFIFPLPAVVAQIIVWGQIQATQITQDGDKTIFSTHDVSGNEAIVKKALADAVRRIDAALAEKEEKGAVTLLAIIWDKVQKRQQTAQTLNRPMFNVPNLFPGNNAGFTPGNFGVNLDEDD